MTRWYLPAAVLTALLFIGACGGAALAASPTGPGSASGSAAGGTATPPVVEQPSTGGTTPSTRQGVLVAAEKGRLAAVRSTVLRHRVRPGQVEAPYRVDVAGRPTLVLPARTLPYTMDGVEAADPQAITREADDAVVLHESLVVVEGATLRLSGPLTVKLSSGRSGFVSVVAAGGRLELLGGLGAVLTVESWDEQRHAVDTDADDGRAYVLAMGSLLARDVTLHALGFSVGRTGGLALVGGGGADVVRAGADVVWQGPAGRAGTTGGRHPAVPTPRLRQVRGTTPGTAPARAAGTAGAGQGTPATPVSVVSGARIDGASVGLSVRRTTGTSLRDITIADSALSGLVLQDEQNVAVSGVRVDRSGRDGVDLRRVTGVALSGVQVSASGRYGINLDNSVSADDDGAIAPQDRYGQNRIDKAQITASRKAGIQIVGGSRQSVTGSSITGQASGIVVTGDATSVLLQDDVVQGSQQDGVVARSAHDVVLTGSTVRGGQSAITIRDSRAQVKGNVVTVTRGHAVVLTGEVAGSTVTGNTLHGTGTQAVATEDLRGTAQVSGNDVTGWTVSHAGQGVLGWVMHPTTLVWVLIALLVVGTWPFYRTLKAIRSPYDAASPEVAVIARIKADQTAAIQAVLAAAAAGRSVPAQPGIPVGRGVPTPSATALPVGISPARPRRAYRAAGTAPYDLTSEGVPAEPVVAGDRAGRRARHRGTGPG